MSTAPGAPGPFLFSADPAAYRAEGAFVVRIPAKARGKEKLLSVLATKLRFPSYFGQNWDALEECLRDLSWLSEQMRVVIVHEAFPFSAAGDSLATYQSILADAVAVHRQRGTPPLLEVVFPGPPVDQAIHKR
jgi:RNAse (barnase) inhibitor barstar